MSERRRREPGINAIIHRAHRRLVAKRIRSQQPAPSTQWKTGPRYGQQLAAIRSYGGAS